MHIKVLHVVAGDLTEGAAKGAYWLHKGLLMKGIDSRMVVQYYYGNDENDSTIEAINQTNIGKRLKSLRHKMDIFPTKLYRNREKFIFSTGISGYDIRKLDAYQWADIIHLHWINNGMVKIKALSKIDKPIVWTMRDMWPMTGGCHYSLECKSYENGCGYCPLLKSHHKKDLSYILTLYKKRYYPKNLYLVAISNWLAKCAKKSYLFNDFNIEVISNAIDTQIFYAVDKKIAREALGLDKYKKIVLVGATNIHDEYKGFKKFQDSIPHLHNDYLFIFFGNVNTMKLNSLGINYKTLGYLNDSISLRLAYSCADVFVAPSTQEAFGKTLIESMACGTPVVAFDATGPKDIVEHKVTGYLAKPFDSSDLAKGIDWIFENHEKPLSLQARNRVENNYTMESIANKYINLYCEILSEKLHN
ncbi:glycosyltransferase family 4 protein [Methanolobus mangrovi]|uniref:Glycosyltransferase family 4 protein n=1 Tax=Methanolobus mangrovi TaxID=3072977 RepID=A0AA51UH96_9EURY|nr:glycosyltransferase family 4 protein [Methanolobus mangrovi]WMW23234.1 glycosyltransferase family 4 protein [Methanolobus mangrovi]